MVDFFLAVLAGLICGVLSGFGIGGGSLLMVWLTALLSMDQHARRMASNLLYFLPAAGCSLIFHVKNRQIVWKAVVPAAIAGCLTAIPGALLAGSVDTALLRRLFGGFLVLVGISEVFFKGKKTGRLWLKLPDFHVLHKDHDSRNDQQHDTDPAVPCKRRLRRLRVLDLPADIEMPCQLRTGGVDAADKQQKQDDSPALCGLFFVLRGWRPLQHTV